MKTPRIPNKPGYDLRNRFCPDAKLTNPNAVYETPIKTQIGDIPAIIVDPHHEVLPFWYNGNLSRKLLHIDNHADSCADIPTLESLQKQGFQLDIWKYVREHLNIASFIAPGIFYGLVDPVFWFDPREESVLEIESGVKEENGKIRFKDLDYFPRAYPIPDREVVDKLNQGFILDIDLDAFECLEDNDYWIRRKLSLFSVKIHRFLGKRKREKRFSRVKNLLSLVKHPDIITIARSQTPISFVPPENVDFLEKRTLDMLVELYQR